jgi:hypothetical protein
MTNLDVASGETCRLLQLGLQIFYKYFICDIASSTGLYVSLFQPEAHYR